MKLFGHTLSPNAMDFISHYEKSLDKQWRYERLPYDHPSWGDLSQDEGFYIIGVKENMLGEAFEATFCHEFFHALQISRGFPTVAHNSEDDEDVKEYAQRLTFAIADLSADDAVRKHGIDDAIVIKRRYKQLKDLNRTNFARCQTPLGKDLLAVDLITDLHSIEAGQKTLIMQNLKKNLPDVYEMYNAFQEKIEEFGYNTPQGCLKIYGTIINYVELWQHCHIAFRGKQIRSLQQFREALENENKTEHQLEHYFASHNTIDKP